MFKGENDEERHEQGHDQVKEAEYDECRQHIGRIKAGKPCQKDDLQYAKATGRAGKEGDGEGGEEDAKYHDEARIAFRRQGETADAGSADQFQRADDELPPDYRQARINQLERPDAQRLKVKPAADHIKRHQGQQQDTKPPQHLGRYVLEEQGEGFRLGDEYQTAEKHRAEREGEGTERHENTDLAAAQPLRGVGAIPDESARKDGSADIVSQRIGGEGGGGDKA